MKTVLVLDDDADIRDVVTWKLAHAGYATQAAGDGRTGLALALDGDASGTLADLVLIDWTMPGLTGIEICRRLRANPATARLPIIMLTARAQETEVERGFAAGADDYIKKPFSPREMLSRVQAVLARSEIRSGVPS